MVTFSKRKYNAFSQNIRKERLESGTLPVIGGTLYFKFVAWGGAGGGGSRNSLGGRRHLRLGMYRSLINAGAGRGVVEMFSL